MAAEPAVVNQFLDSEEDGESGESDTDSSETVEEKADVANNDAVVNNDDADSTSGEGESEEGQSDSSSPSAPEDVVEDDNAPSVKGEDELDADESDASSSSMADDLLEAHLKKLERLEKGATSPAPAEENQLPKNSSGEAGENQAATSEVTQDSTSESKHAASSKVAPVEVVTPTGDQVEENDAKHMNIIQEGKKMPVEHDKTEMVKGGIENESQKADVVEEKPKELTKAERKALREKMYQKKECDVIDVNTTVYVGNFPRKCSTKDVKKFFSLCGEIEEVVHPKEKNEEDKWVPLGWAFVRFKTSEAAKLARMGTGAKVHGRRITIQKRKKPVERIPLLGGRSVLVKGIPYSATERNIKWFFGKAGKVNAVRILRSKKNRSLGIAFVDFETMDGAYRAIEELAKWRFMRRRIKVSSAYERRFTARPPSSCKSVRIKQLPMGTTREEVEELITETVGLCYVRMGKKLNTCVVDFVTHGQMLALLQIGLQMKGYTLKTKVVPNQGGRYVNPIVAKSERVVIVEPVPPRITEEELLEELKTQLREINYVVIIPGVESRKAYVIFERSTEKALKKKVVNIRGREANIIEWKPHKEIVREEKPPTKVFGCRISKLPKKLTKKRFLDLAEKLTRKREFSLIWELNPKRKKFSGTVELVFELLEDARYTKRAFEEFVVPGTCTGLKVFISERQSDGLWTKKIEDLYEIRGIPRPTEADVSNNDAVVDNYDADSTSGEGESEEGESDSSSPSAPENAKKRSLEEEEESSAKRVRKDDSNEMGVEQEQFQDSDSSSSEKSENSKKRLLQEGDEAPAAKRHKQEEIKDKQENSNLEGKKDPSESWPVEESVEKQVKDGHATTITEQEPEEESAKKQVKEENATILTEQKPSGMPAQQAPESANVEEK